MKKLLLAGDVGGTKTNLALYSAHGEMSPVFEQTYRNSEFDSMESLLRQFQLARADLDAYQLYPAAGSGAVPPLSGR